MLDKNVITDYYKLILQLFQAALGFSSYQTRLVSHMKLIYPGNEFYGQWCVQEPRKSFLEVVIKSQPVLFVIKLSLGTGKVNETLGKF